jgi:hypothetical protein
MRKWICVGVLGGLLEFGIVYQVAFSNSDSPAPETLRASESNSSKTRGNAKKPARRSPRHIASAVGTADQAAPADPTAEVNLPTGTGNPSTTPASPAAGSTTPPVQTSASPPAADDPLTATLKAAASAVATLPMSLGLTGAPVEGALIPGLPVSLPGLQPAISGVEELAKVIPLTASAGSAAPVPAPVDVSKLPIEELIRHVFGPEGDKAVAVARCESTMRTHAKKGQFLGLFQLGANERADYGHGPDALAQVLAAHELFLDRGWQPWACA